MNYLDTVKILITVLYGIMALLTIHFLFFAVVGVFKKKKFPHTDEKLKYGIIIPARNEEAVVRGLIESVQKNEYPQDKLHIFVIAHNCTDRTAEIAREAGATVYEYNNPNECTMGYAFRYLFDRIREDYGVENYDGFFLFNADNILDKHYFDKMNDAFVACDRKSVITSFRNSKNFGSNVMSALYGLYFAYGCRYESRGRTVLGCSTRVQGTGYVINSDIVKDGWKYVTLTEDWEFTADQLLQGTKIVFCDDAVFYDEQPTGFKVMWRQRVRWAKGHLLVCISRLKDLLRALFTPASKGGSRQKFSIYDISVNILPVCVISAGIFLIQIILHALAFFIVYHCDLPQLWIDFQDWLKWDLIVFIASYIPMVFATALIYILERKRFPKVSLPIKILSCLLWPAFLFLSIPMEVVALFSKNLGWKPIPHSDTTDFDTLNATHTQAEQNTESSSENL